MRHRTLFRDTGAPYLDTVRPLAIEPTARVGSFDGRIDLDLPNVRGRFPLLDRGFEPQDADLKFGPIFFKLRALSAGILHSDNVNREEEDRESGTIAIVRLAGTVIAQLTEGLRIAVSGNFVYLPLEGKGGVAGFGLIAPYTFGLEGVPVLQSQVAWDTKIGNWDVIISDDFRIGIGRYSVGSRDDFELFEGGRFDEFDRAGRYVFRAPLPSEAGRRHQDLDDDTDILYYSNTISAATERLLPGTVRLRVRAYREDLWYNQGRRGLPSLREGLNVFVASERDNMRFKPFALYNALHTSRIDGFDHEFRIGVNGPITDQLKLHADFGWFHRDESGSNRFLWNLELRHLAGPYTEESLIFARQFSDFHEELNDHITYRIRQVLGAKLTGEAFASYAQVEDLEDDRGDRNEFRTGVRLTSVLGPRTTVRLTGIYADLDSDRSFGNRQTWTGRLELTYRITDTFVSRLLYQYQERDSERRGRSYYENLVFMTLTKYFD